MGCMIVQRIHGWQLAWRSNTTLLDTIYRRDEVHEEASLLLTIEKHTMTTAGESFLWGFLQDIE
jgi:hypothetical protein